MGTYETHPPLGPPQRVKLAIAVALPQEARVLAGALSQLGPAQREQLCWLRTGVGEAHQGEVGHFLAGFPNLRLVCSSGFCGGLREEIRAGDLVLSSQVRREVAPVPSPGDPNRYAASAAPGEGGTSATQTPSIGLELIAKELRRVGLSWHQDPVVVTEAPVLSAGAKTALGRRFGAVAVDMESAMLEGICARRGAGFLILRAVSDSAQEDLPPEISGFLDRHGRVRLGSVLRFAVKRPANLGVLVRLNRNASRAERRLRAAWQAVLPALLEEL